MCMKAVLDLGAVYWTEFSVHKWCHYCRGPLRMPSWIVTFIVGVERMRGVPDLKNFLGVGVPSVRVSFGTTTLLRFMSPSWSRQDILGFAFFFSSFTCVQFLSRFNSAAHLLSHLLRADQWNWWMFWDQAKFLQIFCNSWRVSHLLDEIIYPCVMYCV